MADQRDIVSVAIALEYVVLSGVVFLLFPFETTVWLVPFFLLFLVALVVYLR